MTEEERKKAREEAEKQIEELGTQPQAMVDFTLFFDDWREVDGIKFPHKMRRAMGGETNEEWTVNKVKVNPKIDPKKFEGEAEGSAMNVTRHRIALAAALPARAVRRRTARAQRADRQRPGRRQGSERRRHSRGAGAAHGSGRTGRQRGRATAVAVRRPGRRDVDGPGAGPLQRSTWRSPASRPHVRRTCASAPATTAAR